jgi:hypothetical protein
MGSESPMGRCILGCGSGQVKDQTTTAVDPKILNDNRNVNGMS